MNLVLTAAQTREIDRIAIEDLGVPGLLLMEHAGRAVALVVDRRLERSPVGRVWIIAGGGNNGGDGYAAGRLLLSAGRDVRVLAVVPPGRLQGDAALQASMYRKYGGEVSDFSAEALETSGGGDVVIDALLGTGISRPPEGTFALAILAMNDAASRGAEVVSVDLPSGVCADTGRVLGAVVRADATVTFGAWKRGLLCFPGAELAGEVEVADISWPPGVVDSISPSVRLLDEPSVRALLPRRGKAAHKGSFGHCLVVAGSQGKSGAASMSGLGALVGGAGLATVACRPAVLPGILSHAMELMGAPIPGDGPLSLRDADEILTLLEDKDVLLIGPGIPRGHETGEMLGRIIEGASCPMVLDADALNALAGNVSFFRKARGPVVITPHPGEMARLLGVSVAEVQGDRIETARRFAEEQGCTVVLKGAGTVIADPDGNAAICPTGNAGMATGGSGDILGGLLAALLAQGLGAGDAARAAVYVHGLAGDGMIGTRGMAGLLASDLLEGIGEVWASWSR